MEPEFIFRPWNHADQKALMNVANHDGLRRYLRLSNHARLPLPFTSKDAEDFIERQNSDPFKGLAIEYFHDEVAGGIQLEFPIESSIRFAQLEYWLTPNWGSSMFKQVLKKMIEVSLTNEIQVLYSQTLHRNQLAASLFRKAGFVIEKTLPSGVPEDLDLGKGSIFVRQNE